MGGAAKIIKTAFDVCLFDHTNSNSPSDSSASSFGVESPKLTKEKMYKIDQIAQKLIN